MSSEKDLENQSRKKSFDENGIPDCLRWTVSDVEQWVEEDLKFPQYRLCFSNNLISGKKLIHMNASNLPRIGITDFEHIKEITAKVRGLLGVNYPYWNRPINLPPKDTMEHFIERKSISGKESDNLTFEEHVRYLNEFELHGVSK
ncbi:sterile alpha motif domain-containing protein 15-like [Hydractinia symbiolongicarpus]|uniref:sterile alpha motif domain-containing protein 15-like n=1 Tax=Hydractinia symbiolongicarpus TaxID=13093 RepID=UPI00254D629B|nr:sterile alpha motif domain-containing protein 15-like [Hydractinia symbiolongicarpus]